MAKRGRYSNEATEHAEQFIHMMDGEIKDAHGMVFERFEMFWDEVTSGERDDENAKRPLRSQITWDI